MTTAAICRIVSGAIVSVLGVTLAIAGIQLWRRGSTMSPDMIASENVIRSTSICIIGASVLLLVAGAAVVGNVEWGGYVAAMATLVVVFAAHLVNQALFGQMRWWKTVANVIMATMIFVLLWYGYASPAS